MARTRDGCRGPVGRARRHGQRTGSIRSGAVFRGEAENSVREIAVQPTLSKGPCVRSRGRTPGLTENHNFTRGSTVPAGGRRGGSRSVPASPHRPCSCLPPREDSPAAFPDRQGLLPTTLFHPTPVHPKAPPGPEVRIYDASTGKLIRQGAAGPGPPGSLPVHAELSSFRYARPARRGVLAGLSRQAAEWGACGVGPGAQSSPVPTSGLSACSSILSRVLGLGQTSPWLSLDLQTPHLCSVPRGGLRRLDLTLLPCPSGPSPLPPPEGPVGSSSAL